ncbi:MAG: AbrB/MazE/SpoVT family DNA-binding domain-containing protein [Candidatus Subteraquimicrobiales bacterium]|nr:AbrB/MazE/SpoVT family DNA-binding domain-containing protein [Candidatus Subteraquimicrobiales bacterium]
MQTLRVSSKGQIVIPIELREKYGLEKGVKIGILEFPEEIVIVPLPRDAIKAAKGMLQSKKSVRRMLEDARKEERSLEHSKKRTRKAS